VSVAQPLSVCAIELPHLFDPERVFSRLYGRSRVAFWLDSSWVDPALSRFSIMGAPRQGEGSVVTYAGASNDLRVFGVPPARRTIFSHLQERLGVLGKVAAELPFDFTGGFVGYFGYELRTDRVPRARLSSPLPDAAFLFIDRFLAFDHERNTTWIVAIASEGERAEAESWMEGVARLLEEDDGEEPPPAPGADPLIFRLASSRERYGDEIRQCLDKLRAGESYEICLTNRIDCALSVDPLLLYGHLRRRNPAPFAAFLRFGDFAVLSSSPERFLRLGADRTLEAKPIKGTAARLADAAADSAVRERLRTSEKERAENLMIVDLLRNDLGIVSAIGSVHVPSLMAVETYATVHHLVSTIRGRLRDGLSAVDAVQAAFPGGSMTGAPKWRTMQILESLERRPRGIYSGALGYLSLNGTMDLGMVIRTIVHAAGGISIGTGGAIVIDSDPEAEVEEILLKARRARPAFACFDPTLQALAGIPSKHLRVLQRAEWQTEKLTLLRK
jgi:para-aminobenzoate synthetase